MKTIKLFIAASLMAGSMFGQSLNDAIKKTNNELFESADAMFKTLILQQPNMGEIYFYYGENFFRNEQPDRSHFDKANEMYQKGAEVNATNPFPYVGLGKVQWFNGKQAEAKANFYKATTLAAGKNATVLMKIAEAYINAETKNLDEAIALLNLAAKLEPKNPEVYILTGDAYFEKRDGTKAVENYEKAGTLDPKSPRALIKQGELYNAAKNYNLALDFYKKANTIDSTYAPAYRAKAEIYNRAGQHGNAVAQIKKYLQLNNDCGARARAAGFLTVAKQYQDAVNAALEAQKCDSSNVYLYRYLAISYLGIKDYPNGAIAVDKFFQKAKVDKIIAQDHETRGKLYAQTGKDSLAILDFQKAMTMDTAKKELVSDIANAYMKMKKYKEAIEMLMKKTEGGKGSINDYFSLARAYYQSKDFVNADSAGAMMIRLKPDMYHGYLQRAKANVQLDPKNEKWLAKEFYELYISKVKPEEAAAQKNDLVNAYTYLAAYSAFKKNCEDTKMYFQKVLDIDANNAQAKKFMAAPCK